MRVVKPSHLLIVGLLISAFALSNRFFAYQKVIATITDDRLLEVSGLEESYVNPGYFWTHNDSGGEPTLYLIDRSGQIQMEVELEGLKNRDWEEIITVKKDDKSFIYIAEIGDNRAIYDHVSLICLEEPIFQGKQKLAIEKSALKVMSFQYSEGSRDAEAMLFDRHLEEFVLITKREQMAMVYSFPFEPNEAPVTIQSKGTIPSRNFTAADMNEHGEILLKNYDSIFYWNSSAKPAADQILAWKPMTLDYTPEPQGEAICWYQGDFYTISEKNKGKPQEMLFFQRLK
ncbi:hypothetical protein [Ekhidna sp.]|uniref:hypothetical protein n=1 Tax=Ekhidna sp. TaxID=2608089 RepID=UPI003C7ABDD3